MNDLGTLTDCMEELLSGGFMPTDPEHLLSEGLRLGRFTEEETNEMDFDECLDCSESMFLEL